MKTIIKKVHYCEFCKRKGFLRPNMEKHEKSCGGNPNRVCGMCRVGQLVQKPLNQIFEEMHPIPSFETGTYASNEERAARAKKLMQVTEGCPACALAYIRQYGAKDMWIDFDWKKEKDAFFKEMNEANGGYAGFVSVP